MAVAEVLDSVVLRVVGGALKVEGQVAAHLDEIALLQPEGDGVSEPGEFW